MRFTLAVLFSLSPLLLPVAAMAAPHRYDHVVIVIEENTSFNEVIGNPDEAPFLNELANEGVSFTQFYSITHPSQPNYFELFSGDFQGVRDDGLPIGYPWSTPNLGAALFAAGATFGGFAEDLPEIGDRDTFFTDGIMDGEISAYRRKHNPWTNWQAAVGVDPLPPNQLPATSTRRFLDFPSDYSELPTVAFVIPNEQHNMHDGTTRMADDWARAHLAAYAQWALSHNSLLVITFDEDNFQGPNQIPTIFYGAGIRPGSVNSTTWTLHNLLRTIADMYGALPPGSAANVPPIAGVFPADEVVLNTRFRQGENNYDACADTFLRADAPDTGNGSSVNLLASQDVNSGVAGNQPAQILVRFDRLFGTNAGQVPSNAQIISAKLIFWTGIDFDSLSGEAVSVHRMLKPWSPGESWNAWHDGIGRDDVEAASAATFTLRPTLANAPVIFDVTADVTAFTTGVANRGWVLNAASSDTWSARSSKFDEIALRPTLEIAYAVPTAPGYSRWQKSQFGAAAGQAGTLAGDDPDRDGGNNLLEYVTNSQPSRAASLNRPAVGRTAQGTTFSFSRSLDAVDVTLRVEVKNNALQSGWTAIAMHTELDGWLVGVGISLTDVGGAVQLTDSAGPPDGTQRFYRLKVTRP